ncbi:U3 small nucleolar ribonucleoprotein protein imp3-like [Plakobranchus ocellatus]|uniref:U3 small nucleolar ribonucleoprotein protein IMP3 n=1 Tax=Plakobranchus ocellatus TaxID=259542 RepID=A0AAV4B9E9_9GAST|nr:U3 small nucleolar ribonucleoprotein protein imp3-like [Plakobranchus ocellatus]
MVRKLKFHEKKLLKKVDFLSWEVDNNLHELKIMKRFYIQRREDYSLYNKLSRQIRKVSLAIKDMDQKHPRRVDFTEQLLEKLHSMGLIPTKRSLSLADRVTASSFCRRRLPVLMVRNHMSETLKAATTFVEQGHVRVGPHVIDDPAYLVTRGMEDFVSWKDTSKIKRQVEEYNDMRDDFDLA